MLTISFNKSLANNAHLRLLTSWAILKPKTEMKQIFCILGVLLFAVNFAYGQVQSGAYRGNLVEEQVYSRSQGGYISVDNIYMTTKIVFTKNYIVFKKGNSDWLKNAWTFDKTERFSNGKKYDVYHDEREQQVLVDYENSEILYYYNWDTHTNRFSNVAIYKNLREDKSILDEFEDKSSTVEKFRIDYNNVSIYDTKTDKWSDWKSGFNTFVVNINDNGDIMHIKANGEKVTYRKLSGVEEGNTKEGKHYQIIKALDDEGDTFSFQIFDDEEIGLKMMYGNVFIQFAKF